MNNQLLSASDAAEIADCHQDTIRRAIETGNLAAQKVGRTWVIDQSALDKWVENGKPNRRRDSARQISSSDKDS
ncbi:MAG: helix-turn-helix domain-containing protein [Chloroflexota bacterium]